MLARSDFLRWTDCLLDPTRSPAAQRDAAHAWCRWGLRFLGIDEHDPSRLTDPFFTDTRLSHGKAISPLGAARCLREYRRTAVFLQAMDEAIRHVLARFPDESINVVEAGCGPLAPLALAFAVRYPATRVRFTLVDLHPTALAGARRVADAFGVADSIRETIAADAATLIFNDAARPHLIACEVLLRALTREPQVAVTRNLVPQLRPGGRFLPECIDVDAALFSPARYYARARTTVIGDLSTDEAPAIIEVGRGFSLDATNIAALQPCTANRFRAHAIRVPPHDTTRTSVQLLTRIRVFGDHRLGDFDSSLNLPARLKYPPELAVAGGEIQFVYESSVDPGLRIEKYTIDPGN